MMTCPRSQFVTVAIFVTTSLHVCGQTPEPGPNGQALQQVNRGIPTTAGHPGNVFLTDEVIRVRIPEERHGVRQWCVTNETEAEVLRGVMPPDTATAVEIGKLPPGWYRIGWSDASGKEQAWTTAAVLTPLLAPTPQDSPICVDSATAWFAEGDPGNQKRLSQLAALAGVNWVRDRMRWRDIQPQPDQLLENTTYDSSATIQHDHGLKVLQVFHDTPRWAALPQRGTGRIPTDLRHVYRFARAMSQRYQGRVQAWEPWNEANVANFGGHTMDEICSYQKAAYLGFRAGDSGVTVCWNAITGIPTERQTDAILLNEAWSYFDTYNIHTYDWADGYERLWGPARRAACGKPLWITESDRGMAMDSHSPTQDLSPQNQLLKAQYITQSYVQSLHAGAHRHFHFVLGQYREGNTQFGLLRYDMTPRPGYVALATLGRLLAGARRLGRFEQADHAELHAYAMRARPQGREQDVLILWAEKNVDWPDRGKMAIDWRVPSDLQIEHAYDYLGRTRPLDNQYTLTSAPLFLLLPKGECDRLPLTRSTASPRRPDVPSSVVLQCALPRGSAVKLERIPWAWEYEYAFRPGVEREVPVYVYNFGSKAIRGTVRLERAPEGCQVQPDQWSIELQPMERRQLTARVVVSGERTGQADNDWILLRGDLDVDHQPVVAFRFVTQ